MRQMCAEQWVGAGWLLTPPKPKPFQLDLARSKRSTSSSSVNLFSHIMTEEGLQSETGLPGNSAIAMRNMAVLTSMCHPKGASPGTGRIFNL